MALHVLQRLLARENPKTQFTAQNSIERSGENPAIIDLRCRSSFWGAPIFGRHSKLFQMIFVSLLLLFTYIPLLFAAPMSKEDAEAKILKYENENDGSGNYHFSFETSNGISRDETGTLVNPGQPDAHIEVLGTVSYSGPDGELISVRYSADENGYHILPADSVSLVHELAQGVPPAVVASLLGG